MDYSHFEGKVVTVNFNNEYFYDGIISGCDSDLGITIQNADNKDDYLVCLHGKMSPKKKFLYTGLDAFENERIFNEVFKEFIKGIEKGRIDVWAIHEKVKAPDSKNIPSAEDCPFNQ